jgi:hypothetical protein
MAQADFAHVGKIREDLDSLAEWCSAELGERHDFGGGQEKFAGDIVAVLFDGRSEARATDTRNPKPIGVLVRAAR